MFLRTHAGFHLLEVAVSLALIATLLCASYPVAASFSRAGRLRQDTELLAARLNQAAELALVSGETTRALFESERYRIEAGGTTREWTLSPSVTFSPIDMPLVYYPSGAARPTTITLLSDARSCVVTVSLRSRVQYSCG